MTYTRKRRLELWFSFAVFAVLAGVLIWLAIALEYPALWWFGGSCVLLTSFMAWKAMRPDRVFEIEEEKFDEFHRNHPVLGAILFFCAIAGASWTIANAVYRVFGALMK